VLAGVFAAHGPTSCFSPTHRGAPADLSRCKRLPGIAVNCALVVRDLGDGVRDPAPDGRALAIAGFGKGIGARGAFRPGLVALALEQ
jgi:hypothetical protein